MQSDDKKKDILRPLEADGIQEFDNPMPRWWVWLFYFTIIVGVGYAGYKHLMSGETLIEAYNKGVAANQAPSAESGGEAGGAAADTEPLEDKVKKPENIEAGKALFATNCAACHGADGGGTVGPNLTDKFFLHGRTPAEVVKVISEGVPANGMIAWKPILGQQKVEQVAAYVLTLIGTTPATAKAPQGQEIP